MKPELALPLAAWLQGRNRATRRARDAENCLFAFSAGDGWKKTGLGILPFLRAVNVLKSGHVRTAHVGMTPHGAREHFLHTR